MEKVIIPKTDILVSNICLGTNVFGWSADEQMSKSILSDYLEKGGNFIDSADKYVDWMPGNKGGESEVMIGNWLTETGNREKVILATKIGKLPTRLGLSRANIFAAVYDCLRRLQTDYIDILYAHKDDQEVLLEESLIAFNDLIKSGKVRYIGASNYTATRLDEAILLSEKLGVASYVTIQNEYNLLHRLEHETELLPVLKKHGISAIPFFGLAKGFLTGKYQPNVPSDSIRSETVKVYENDRNWSIVENLTKLAMKKNSSNAAIALAWLISRPGVITPVASGKNLKQLNEIFQEVNLTSKELDDLTNF